MLLSMLLLLLLLYTSDTSAPSLTSNQVHVYQVRLDMARLLRLVPQALQGETESRSRRRQGRKSRKRSSSVANQATSFNIGSLARPQQLQGLLVRFVSP